MIDESENHLSPYLLAVLSEEYHRMHCYSDEDNNESSSSERSIKVPSSNEHDMEDFEQPSESLSTTESVADEVVPSDHLTTKRPKYTEAQQNEIIRIFKSHQCQDNAMKEINDIPEFKRIQKRKVIRWIKSSNSGTKMGRPTSTEFESEVLVEVKKNWKPYMGSFNAFVTKTANAVKNREYWSEEKQAFCVKKWKEEKQTHALKFTTRWVEGWMKRAMRHANSKVDKN